MIDTASIVGELFSQQVFRVESLLFVPVHNGANDPMAIEEQDQPFVDMIQKVQKDKSFYFSYGLDLTKNIQLQATQQNSGHATGMWPNSAGYISHFAFNDGLLS
jgi:hypothetical protein